MYRKLIRFAMKLSPAARLRTGLRLIFSFVAVSVMFCAILVHIPAMDDSLTRQRGKDQKSNRVYCLLMTLKLVKNSP